MSNGLEKAIEAVGGAAELARKLEVLPQHVANWRRRGVPAGRVLAIERATANDDGQPRVSRHELRPDLYPTEGAAA